MADTALEVGPDGNDVYGTVIVTVPRQSGKTTLLRPVYMHRCLTTKRASTWLTAQTRNDARDLWEQTVEVVEDSALALIIGVRRTNGSEHLDDQPDARPLPRVRPGRAGPTRQIHARGRCRLKRGPSRLEQGEALDQAIVPTQLTIPVHSAWIVSTAGNAKSTWFRAMVTEQRALLEAGTPPPRRLLFRGPSLESTTPAEFDTIARHHPALGHTITRQSCAPRSSGSRNQASGQGARNYWVSSDEYAISPVLWESGTHVRTARRSVAPAAETSADRQHSVIVAGRPTGGRPPCGRGDRRAATVPRGSRRA